MKGRFITTHIHIYIYIYIKQERAKVIAFYVKGR
jgi:hypothetical protein